jgi:UDP-N-acetylmuramoylalanine--D-glutamate ligase
MIAAVDKLNIGPKGGSTAIDLSGMSLVVGLGATGVSVARYLRARDLSLRIIDSRARPPGLDLVRAQCPGVDCVLGSLAAAYLDGASRVIVSPGLSHELALLAEARARGLPIINDIELFAHEAAAPVLAVTGSNGKSTVTTLVARMLEAQGFVAPAGGNLGPPALDLLAVPSPDVYVLEISSFQLEAMHSLKPAVAAVLNVTADHLDRHGSLEAYAALKERLLVAAEQAVVNWDDPIVRAMGRRHRRVIAISANATLESGYSIVRHAGTAYLAKDLEPLLAVDSLAMPGAHKAVNALAALAIVDTLGGPQAAALAALERFPGLPHRSELIATRRGVRYVNDSKATNVGATVAALRGLEGPVVLIAGGLGKGADFSPLAEACGTKLTAAFVLGADADRLEHALRPVCRVVRVESLEEAVRGAAALSVPGDTVLLSPACSSLDMFSDYQARGSAFAAAVRELGQ